VDGQRVAVGDVAGFEVAPRDAALDVVAVDERDLFARGVDVGDCAGHAVA
jgi:hypothetical protein